MVVFGLVSAVAGFVKMRYLIDKAVIDNIIFRIHYRITAAILFACCIIVTANNLIGDPINCISDNAVPTHVINTYCWITYTFTLPTNNVKQIGTEVAHPGLGGDYNEKKIYHSYYQWVPFMLFFQGILFYVPHWMWKQWEEGKVRMISDGMRGAIVETKQEREIRINKLVEYILDTLHLHNSYATGYFFCELLNFVNVVGNMFFIDTFLGGAFLTYGTEVITFSNMNQEHRSDPMIERFPRVTKCTFHKFGASGTVQKLDALCVLALNIHSFFPPPPITHVISFSFKLLVCFFFFFYFFFQQEKCTLHDEEEAEEEETIILGEGESWTLFYSYQNFLYTFYPPHPYLSL